MLSVLQALPGALAPLLGVRPALLCTRGAEAQETAGGRDRPCPAARELSWHELPVYRGLLDLTVGANLGARLAGPPGFVSFSRAFSRGADTPKAGAVSGSFLGRGGTSPPPAPVGALPASVVRLQQTDGVWMVSRSRIPVWPFIQCLAQSLLPSSPGPAHGRVVLATGSAPWPHCLGGI